MALRNYCRLCVNTCCESEKLYDENGCGNEKYKLIVRYFHPKFVDMQLATHLTSICSQCWQHISDFQSFQMSILDAQNSLELTHAIPKIKNENIDGADNFEITYFKADSENEVENLTDQHNAEDMEQFIQPKCEINDVNSDVSGDDNDDNDEDDDEQQPAEFEITEFDEEPTQQYDEDEDAIISHSIPSDPNANFALEIRRRYKERKIDDIVVKCVPNIKCGICEKTFKVYTTYKLHFHQKHSSEEFYINCFCSTEKMLKYDQIKDHFLLHNEPEFFKCAICEHMCVNMNTLNKHLSSTHSQYLKHVCSICGKSLSSKRGLAVHYTTMHMNMKPMAKSAESAKKNNNVDDSENSCGDPPSPKRLKTKCRSHNPKATSVANNNFLGDFRTRYEQLQLDDLLAKWLPHIICTICSESFANISTYKYHFDDEHPRQEFHLKCFCSNEKLKRNEKIKDHFVLHEDADFFKCGICGLNNYNSKKSLDGHVVSMHSEYLENTCNICLQRISTTQDLQLHYRKVHGVNENTIGTVSTDSGLKYVCRECGKIFNGRKNMNSHILHVHKKPKTYKCECGIVFKSRRVYREHNVTHTGKAIYACAFCSDTFRSITAVVRHRKSKHPQEQGKTFYYDIE